MPTRFIKTIDPYFRERGVALENLQASDIQDFHTLQLEHLKATTVIHYHAVIHKALKHAVKMDMIPSNPADKVERPHKDAFQASFYDKDERNALFAAAKGTPLEIPIMLAAFYGLRRSEVVGLKWDAIDLERNAITIRHTVTTFTIDGKRMLVASDTTKTKSSMRTLPLVPVFAERLDALKAEQQENRRTELGLTVFVYTHPDHRPRGDGRNPRHHGAQHSRRIVRPEQAAGGSAQRPRRSAHSGAIENDPRKRGWKS